MSGYQAYSGARTFGPSSTNTTHTHRHTTHIHTCTITNLITGVLRIQVHGQGGRLDVLGQVDDLCQPGHTQGHVLGGHTRKMEGV
eukprot:1160914-Pelagomonas_calceolata.AAC.22